MAHTAFERIDLDAEEALMNFELDDLPADYYRPRGALRRVRWALLAVLGVAAVAYVFSRTSQGSSLQLTTADSAAATQEWLFGCSDEFKTPKTRQLVEKYPAWGTYLGVEPMPEKPTNWAELKATLNDTFQAGDKTFGFADVDKAAQILYAATRVEGIFERVPEKLRGVFWLKGLPVPEVLASIQYGWWYEQEQTLVTQFLPMDWAWYGAPRGTIPKDINWFAAWFGGYRNGGRDQALAQTSSSYSYSYTFKPCPRGHKCKEGANNMSYAILEGKSGNHLDNRGGLGDTLYTIEELEGVQPGSRWYRGVYDWCGRWHTMGYYMTKIIDAEGRPLEPYYSEWQKFMQGHPLILWSGDTKYNWAGA